MFTHANEHLFEHVFKFVQLVFVMDWLIIFQIDFPKFNHRQQHVKQFRFDAGGFINDNHISIQSIADGWNVFNHGCMN